MGTAPKYRRNRNIVTMHSCGHKFDHIVSFPINEFGGEKNAAFVAEMLTIPCPHCQNLAKYGDPIPADLLADFMALQVAA